jgi:hypothetical protein
MKNINNKEPERKVLNIQAMSTQNIQNDIDETEAIYKNA